MGGVGGWRFQTGSKHVRCLADGPGSVSLPSGSFRFPSQPCREIRLDAVTVQRTNYCKAQQSAGVELGPAWLTDTAEPDSRIVPCSPIDLFVPVPINRIFGALLALLALRR